MKKMFMLLLAFSIIMSTQIISLSAEPEVKFREHSYVIPEISEKSEQIEDFVVYTHEPEYNTGRSWTKPPVIIKTSDAVNANNAFFIFGEGFINRNLKAVISPSTSNIPPVRPPSDAISLSILQIDHEIKYITAKLPEGAASVTYDLWVGNDNGWSLPVRLNDARPEWQAEDVIAAGFAVDIYGKNMDASEFGGITNSKVAFYDGEKAWSVPVTDANPFRMQIVLPDNVPLGKYQVFASNDGGITWNSVERNNIYMTVIEKTQDPLNLGVAWVNEFNWDNRLNAKDFGAKGDGKNDDAPALQAAMDKAAEEGGVVFLPEGNYRFCKTLEFPGYVVMEGEGKDKTILTYDFQGEGVERTIAIREKGKGQTDGRTGLARLTVTINPESGKVPDMFLSLGHTWGLQATPNARTTKYIFLKDFELNYDMDQPKAGRGFGLLIVADSHVLIAESNFKGFSGTMVFSYIKWYTTLRNNDFYFAKMNIHNVGAMLSYYNNDVVFFPDLALDDGYAQGFFIRGPSYISDNYITNTGWKDSNDGEIICTENPGEGTKIEGDVKAAAEDSVTIKTNYVKNWQLEEPEWGDKYCIVIVKGRGQGQYAYIDSFDNSTHEEDGLVEFKLDKNWKVIPDSTSKVVVMANSEYNIFYNNIAKTGSKGIWFFGDTMNSVIADNNCTDTEGIYIRAVVGNIPREIGYFNRVARNTLSGKSKKSEVCAISVDVSVECEFFVPDMTALYGNEVRDNYMHDLTGRYNRETAVSEAPDYNGITVSHMSKWKIPFTPVMHKATLVEGNRITNSDYGLTVGGFSYQVERTDWRDNSRNSITSGIIVKDNKFTDVQTPLRQIGVNRLIFTD